MLLCQTLSSFVLDGKSASVAPESLLLHSPLSCPCSSGSVLVSWKQGEMVVVVMVQKISSLWNQNAWVEILTQLLQSHYS